MQHSADRNNCRSAPPMHQRICATSIYGRNGPKKTDEQPAYVPLKTMAPSLSPTNVIKEMKIKLFHWTTECRQVLLLFNSHFSRWTWVSRSPSGPTPSTCSEKDLLGLAKWGFLWAGCLSCHQPLCMANLFLIHNRTLRGRGIAPFMMALTSSRFWTTSIAN